MTHIRTPIWPLWKTHTSQLGQFLSLTFCVYLLPGLHDCPINHWRFFSLFLLSFTSSGLFCLFCLFGSFLLRCLFLRLFLLSSVLNFLLLSALKNPSLLLLASKAYMSELLKLLLSFISLHPWVALICKCLRSSCLFLLFIELRLKLNLILNMHCLGSAERGGRQCRENNDKPHSETILQF